MTPESDLILYLPRLDAFHATTAMPFVGEHFLLRTTFPPGSVTATCNGKLRPRPIFRNFSITLCWSSAFRRYSATFRLKAGLQHRVIEKLPFFFLTTGQFSSCVETGP